jgi:hypothetical protein
MSQAVNHGGFMTRLLQWGCWVLVSVGSMWPIASFASVEPPARDCGLRQFASIDLKVGSIVLIPVNLNGAPAFMGLNISLPISTINLEAATDKKLVMHKAPEPFFDAPGIVSIDSFSLGAYNLGKVQLLVFPGQNKTIPGLPTFIGSIALPSLLKADFELDFAHNKLNLFATDHCPGNVVYWTDKAAAIPYTLDRIGIPVFPIELDGKKISAALRLSASGTTLKTDASKALYGFDENSSDIRSDRSQSGTAIKHYRAMKMTLPGLSVTNADVQLMAGLDKNCEISPDSGPEHSATYKKCFGNPPLTLGLDVLQHLRLYFATEEHILYVTAAEAGWPAADKE